MYWPHSLLNQTHAFHLFHVSVAFIRSYLTLSYQSHFPVPLSLISNKQLRSIKFFSQTHFDDTFSVLVLVSSQTLDRMYLFACFKTQQLQFIELLLWYGATNANFLGHPISPAGLRPNAEKVSALVKMPMPKDVKQVRALMGGINYYRNFSPDLSKTME